MVEREVLYSFNNSVYKITDTDEVHASLGANASEMFTNYLKQNPGNVERVVVVVDTSDSDAPVAKPRRERAEADYWSPTATKLLLQEYKKRVDDFRNPKFKKGVLWREIQKVFEQKGYNDLMATGIDEKIRRMKRTYNRIKMNKSKNWYLKEKVTWKYFSEMDEIFGDHVTSDLQETSVVVEPDMLSLELTSDAEVSYLQDSSKVKDLQETSTDVEESDMLSLELPSDAEVTDPQETASAVEEPDMPSDAGSIPKSPLPSESHPCPRSANICVTEAHVSSNDDNSPKVIVDVSTGKTSQIKEESALESSESDEEKQDTWTPAATELLLEEYKKRYKDFNKPRTRKRPLWREIRKIFNEKGFNLNEIQLEEKLRNMKKTFRRINENDDAEIKWPYFNLMMDIYGDDQPVSVRRKKKLKEVIQKKRENDRPVGVKRKRKLRKEEEKNRVLPSELQQQLPSELRQVSKFIAIKPCTLPQPQPKIRIIAVKNAANPINNAKTIIITTKNDALPGNTNSPMKRRRKLQDNEKRDSWTPAAIELLLEEYKKIHKAFNNPKIRKRPLWREIRKVFKENGFNVNEMQLDEKLRNLRKTFRRIKEKKSDGEIKWKYFNLMTEIYDNDAVVQNDQLASDSCVDENRELGNEEEDIRVPSERQVLSSELQQDLPPELCQVSKYISIESCTPPQSQPEIRIITENDATPLGKNPNIRIVATEIVAPPGNTNSPMNRWRKLHEQRKQKLALESKRVETLLKIQEAVERSNAIQQERNILLQKLFQKC